MSAIDFTLEAEVAADAIELDRTVSHSARLVFIATRRGRRHEVVSVVMPRNHFRREFERLLADDLTPPNPPG